MTLPFFKRKKDDLVELRRMLDEVSTPTVMLVDDSADTLQCLQTDLRDLNVNLLTAKDGAEAVDLIQQFHIDIMFLDLLMPRLNGYEVLEWMDWHDVEFKTIVLTGDPTNPLILKALDLGPVTLMSKPWTPKAVRKALMYVPFTKAYQHAPAT